MSPESAAAATAPMRGHEAWRRTHEVRERFLAAGDPDRLPPEDCGVRREIVLSWRRSLLSGVDAASTDLPCEVFIANDAALSLLGGADCDLLRHWACDAAAAGREATARLRLGPDLVVTARCRPLAGKAPAAMVVLARSAAPVTAARTAPGPPCWERVLEQLGQARAIRLPVLLRGERGTGKTALARRLHDQAAAPLTVLDAAAGVQDWAGRLRAALADPAGTVVVQHLDALDPALTGPTGSLIESPRARLAATVTRRDDERADLAALAERFPVVLDVPPLRERPADIPSLITGIIAELRPRPPRPRCTPEALAALAGSEWPGNVRQLRQVVATALVRSLSCDITADDLPGEYAGAARGRRLTQLERAEREVLVAALRDAAWDREAAARELGISRATIYRKLKRFGIRPPALRAGTAVGEAEGLKGAPEASGKHR